MMNTLKTIHRHSRESGNLLNINALHVPEIPARVHYTHLAGMTARHVLSVLSQNLKFAEFSVIKT
ncbi:MAG: hypothetical protein AAF228_04935 [Pseudomonadota bacterium]